MLNTDSKYKLIVRFVEEGITAGRLQKGDWIPSINEFRHIFNLSRDTVFAGSVGRCDLLGGDSQKMAQSIRRLKQEIDPSCVLLPGHGPDTTMAHELAWNPYFV